VKEENRSGEVSFFDLFNVLRRYRLLLLGMPAISAVLAFCLVSLVLHPTWEASAVLEVGHVGVVEQQVTQVTQVTQVLVEPIPNVVTRMMLPSFAKGAINYAGTKPDELKTMQGFYGTLKVNQVKGVELIEIKLRGPSAEMANNLIQGAIINLQKVHSEMMAVSIEKNQKQLQMLTEDIHKASAEVALLRQRLLANHNWNDYDATLVATILKDKSSELRDMNQRKFALEEQMSPSRTYTTRVVDEVYISEGAVSPKKQLIIGLAILLGLLGAMVITFVHNAFISKSA
jgi:capsular polysaccharide biosynthesis protein